MRRLAFLIATLATIGVASADESFVSIKLDDLVGMASLTGANCTVDEIVATNDGKGIDPKLDRMKGQLSKPPFSAWNTFKLLGEQTGTVDQNKAYAFHLSIGTLTLLLRDRNATRLHFDLTLDDKDGKRVTTTTVTIDTSAPLILGNALPYPSGTYILALGCL